MSKDYTDSEIKLAREFATALNDTDSISMHLKFVRQYRVEFLHRILKKVLAIPDHEVQNRAALYVHLVKQAIRYGNGY